MSPEQLRIQELERQVKILTDFMMSFESSAQLDPNIQLTIRRVAGNVTLAGLSDVVLSSPTNGQVLKYNGTNWYNGTDEVV